MPRRRAAGRLIGGDVLLPYLELPQYVELGLLVPGGAVGVDDPGVASSDGDQLLVHLIRKRRSLTGGRNRGGGRRLAEDWFLGAQAQLSCTPTALRRCGFRACPQ